MVPSSRLSEIVEYRTRRLGDSRAAMPRDRVLEWLSDRDLEVLGAAYHTVTAPQFREGILPSLDNDTLQAFLESYFGRCIVEDPQGTWVNGRYSAGWDLVGLMVAAFDADRNAFERWKALLASLYRNGSPDIRRCIENATIEHLFENPHIRSAFADWAKDPDLSAAVEAGDEWISHGGKSALSSQEPD